MLRFSRRPDRRPQDIRKQRKRLSSSGTVVPLGISGWDPSRLTCLSMTAPPPRPAARRLRLGWPRRVFSQVLLMQLAVAGGVAVLATGLFLAPLGAQLDDQAMRRALAIAASTPAQPQIADDLLASRPSPEGPVQREAERIRRATGADYVVVMDTHGVR